MKKFFESRRSRPLTLFAIFLMRNKAYGAFMRNFSSLDSSISFDDLATRHPRTYIIDAFNWASTPEGADYWRYLEDRWCLVVSLFNL